MDTDTAPEPARLGTLRETLIGQLRELDALHSEEVAAAVRAVPRHLFVPEGVTPEQAYAPERAEITKEDKHGVHLSSVSAARVQAMMLEQAAIRPGMRVLEIGSGGYNAALIAELVGEGGEVTSIDIDADIVARARRLLDATGYGRVHTAVADGEEGLPSRAPFDRIIVTVGAWDIPPAWTDQLSEGGRIVVPLRVRGLTRSVALDDAEDHLVSREYRLCGFVPMQGTGEMRVRLAVLHDVEGEEVGLRLDDGQQADTDVLRQALRQPKSEAWSGVTIGGSVSFADLDLYLATTLPDYALLTGTPKAREKGLIASASPLGTSTLLDGESFAYRVVRPVEGEEDLYEFGAYAHGPGAAKVAERLVEAIRAWDREHRDDQAVYRAYPTSTASEQLASGLVLSKRHRIITISWPAHTG